MEPAITLNNVSKRYGGVQALNKLNVSFAAGEVHALLGENGAGKSTLIKLLSGVDVPTEGSISLFGTTIHTYSPITARRLGISTVYQEPISALSSSVSENIFAGRLPRSKAGLFDRKALRRETLALMDKIGVHFDPDALLENLSMAERQLVEILKSISFNARLVIFDEPTSALTKEETDTLYSIIRRLKNEGKTILYISHRLEEAFDLCDTVTVLRDGEFIDQRPLSQLSYEQVIRLMVGRNMDSMYPKTPLPLGAEVLRVEHLSNQHISDVSFSLRSGEILGIGGLVGAGRTELMRALFGIDSYQGNVYIDGVLTKLNSPKAAIQAGIAMVPEDRKTEGLVRTMDVNSNISVISMQSSSVMGLLRLKQEKSIVPQLIERLNIKTPSPYQLVDKLSGGNQQKVVFAKWLVGLPRVLILDEPTRGVDVGAKSEIYKIMGELVAQGIGIIMVSSEMPELINMSDRVMVMYEGRVSGSVDRDEFSEEQIMKLSLGAENI